MFRIGAMDSQKMEIYTKPELLAQELQDLPDFHLAGRILVKNSPTRPFILETLEPQQVARHVDTDKILEMSRKKYTRPVQEVEEQIMDWRNNYEDITKRKEKSETSAEPKAVTHGGEFSL